MRKLVLRSVAALPVGVAGLVATGTVMVLAPLAAEAATPGISVDVATPQQVGLDPSAVGVTVGWGTNGCPNGCDLYRVTVLRSNYDEQRLDSRTFASGAVRRFSVSDRITGTPGLGYSFSYEVRRWTNAAHTLYDVVYSADATPSFASEDAFRYGSGWRRELQLASTETMIMRSGA